MRAGRHGKARSEREFHDKVDLACEVSGRVRDRALSKAIDWWQHLAKQAMENEFPLAAYHGGRHPDSPAVRCQQRGLNRPDPGSDVLVHELRSANPAYQPRRALRAVGCMRLFGDRFGSMGPFIS